MRHLSVPGNTRVEWTGPIPLRTIPPTDVLVYFANATDARLLGTAPADANGFTQEFSSSDGKRSSWSEVFIHRINADRGLGLLSPGLEKVEMAAAAFGAAALHEAMHNKIDQAMVHAGRTNFDLHTDGGGGVASALLPDCFEAVDPFAKDVKFRILATERNKLLLRRHLGFRVPQQTRKDFETEVFMVRIGRPPPSPRTGS